MPHLSSAGPAGPAAEELTTVLVCPHCSSPQVMAIIAVYPALYCGKDVIHFQCTKCGVEGTEKVADRLTMLRPTPGMPPQLRDLDQR